MIASTMTEFDVYLWAEGSHYRAYEKLGFTATGNRHPHPYLTPFTELEMVRPA